MDKNKIDKDNITYIDNKYVSQCAFFADMNYPSRKYMEDSNFFNVLPFSIKHLGWIVPGEGDIKGEEAFFVVLDGHGGTKVMEFCEQNLQEVKEKPYQAYLKFL